MWGTGFQLVVVEERDLVQPHRTTGMTTSNPRSHGDDDDRSAVDVVAIDGPSGAGKSTVARRLAERLGYAYLDTGAMYRAVTWYLAERGVTKLDDARALGVVLDAIQLELLPDGRVLVDGRDVTAALRSREVESRVSQVSALPEVRARMRALQRVIATRRPVVAEGRDIGSVVFPNARWKFFLDATPDERARRRHREFERRGRTISRSEVLDEIAARDHLDSTRKDAPLTRAAGAEVIDSTGRDVDSVVAAMLCRVEGGCPRGASSVGAGS